MKDLWAVVRELTPAEGLALVCLASWAKPPAGRVQASDRQVCGQTGVSRDVMKRLRRKLARLGIAVTPGNNLSHDSCVYELGTILEADFTGAYAGLKQEAPSKWWWLRKAAPEAPSPAAKSTQGQGAESAEGPGARGAHTWAQSPPSSDSPYAYIGVSLERGRPRGEAGAIPEGELSTPPTAPVWAGGPSIAIDLPANGLAEAPARLPLPPYEQWVARR
jgi:hypothetical protein